MATSRVDHTVENLEAGQRDSIRRAQAKAAGDDPDEVPSDAEVNQAEAERLAEASSDDEDSEPEASGSQPPATRTRRGPTGSGDPSGSEEG